MPRHKFSKSFSRNTIKVSYSCIPSIKAEIHKHNKSILEKARQKNPDSQLRNCTNKKQRLLNEQCLLRVFSTKLISRKTFLAASFKRTVPTESIVYQANITENIPGNKEKVYLGLSETTFKVRYGNNKKSFTKQHHKNDTEISKEY